MKLKFIKVDVAYKLKLHDYISESGVGGTWPPQINHTCSSYLYVQEIFDLCFKHNGFIAGGAAIKLKRHDQHTGLTHDKIQYSFFPVEMMIQSKNDEQVNKFITACQSSLSDIDLWFRSQNDYDLFMSECKAIFGDRGGYFQTSAGNNATDIIIVSKGKEDEMNPGVQLFSAKIKFQAIHKIFGDPETIMNDFDILNSMIAYDGKQFIHVEGWQDLEDTRTLKLAKISGGTFKKIIKYITEKHYHNVDKSMSKILKDEIVNTIHWINDFDIVNTKEIDIKNLSVFQLQILNRLTSLKLKSHVNNAQSDDDIFTGFDALMNIEPEPIDIESIATIKAKIVSDLLHLQKNIIRSLSVEDLIELSSYQFIENDKEYSFMKQALVDKFQQAFQIR